MDGKPRGTTVCLRLLLHPLQNSTRRLRKPLLPNHESVCLFCLFQYTTEDLLNQIQASEEEIMAQLQVLNACEIGGSIMSTIHDGGPVWYAREMLRAPSPWCMLV